MPGVLAPVSKNVNVLWLSCSITKLVLVDRSMMPSCSEPSLGNCPISTKNPASPNGSELFRQPPALCVLAFGVISRSLPTFNDALSTTGWPHCEHGESSGKLSPTPGERQPLPL